MRRRDRFLLLISVFALAGEAHALSSDKEQPIHIEADSVVIDDARGVATYRGNVHYSQGSAHLNADEVIVYSADRKQVDKVEAKGSPATFRQRPDNKDEDIRGQSLRIDYFANEERIVLETDAHLWQGQNEFTGDRIDERDITASPMHVRARLGLGYLPQEASVFRKLTVAQNILAILETLPNLDRAQRVERCEVLLGELHIAHLRDSMGMSLSGGERRRLEIARALATEPRFILLDEPFAGVDPISVMDIQAIIKQLTEKGIGVLITDHNVRETLGICGRAYIMSEGQVIAEGAPDLILQNARVRQVYLGEHFTL